MNNCFENIIGIKSICNQDVPSSGLYIEDIGITADECGLYINKEYTSGTKLIEDKISFSSKLIRTLINNHFASHINSKSVIEGHNLGIFQDSLNLKSGVASNYGGINITLNNERSYLKLYVNSISLQISTTQDVSVKVFDLISGETLDTIVVSCVANKVSTKYVNKEYTSNKRKLDVVFVYDTTGISSNTTNLSNEGCTSCNGYMYNSLYLNAASVYFPTSSVSIRSSLNTNTHTFGMNVNYSLQCATENWLCELTNLLALPILYKTGEEIMNYAVYYSNRQNSSTNVDYERNKERLQAYKDAFNTSIEATIKKINMPKGDICFKCSEPVYNAIILP